MRRFVSHISNKELDRDLELNYFGARYYQPEFPRFLSPDPVGGSPEVPISWNRYLYCRNDPVNRLDPDGRVDFKNGLMIGGASVNIPYPSMDFENMIYAVNFGLSFGFPLEGHCFINETQTNPIEQAPSTNPKLEGTK